MAGGSARLDEEARVRGARCGHRCRACSAASPCCSFFQRRSRPRTPALAEIFFCMTVAIALFTSRGWIERDRNRRRPLAAPRWPRPPPLSFTSRFSSARRCGIQSAGLAIPDFPLMFGGVLPDRWDAGIAVHFAHRVGALIVATAVAATVLHIWWHHRTNKTLTRPAASHQRARARCRSRSEHLTVLSRLNVAINSAHVVCGALVLTTSLVMTLRSWRIAFDRMPRACGRGDRGVKNRPAERERRVERSGTRAARSCRVTAALRRSVRLRRPDKTSFESARRRHERGRVLPGLQRHTADAHDDRREHRDCARRVRGRRPQPGARARYRCADGTHQNAAAARGPRRSRRCQDLRDRAGRRRARAALLRGKSAGGAPRARHHPHLPLDLTRR